MIVWIIIASTIIISKWTADFLYEAIQEDDRKRWYH
jgi:hypothetical protein